MAETTIIKDDPINSTVQQKNARLSLKLAASPLNTTPIIRIERDESVPGWKVFS